MSAANITVSDLEVMSSAENYRNWMFSRVRPFVGQRILEVGCGIGNFTSLFPDRELVVATDIYGPCVEKLKIRLGGQLNVVPMQLDISDPGALALKEYDLDTVVCLNVLEHIHDDVRALRHMHNALRTGGRLVLLVPAFQFLYGSVDRSLEHHRRYTRSTLLPRMREAQFEIERSFYMNVIGMAGWFLNNRVLKRQEENAEQIGLFDRYIAPVADRIERIVPPPFGLSLIAIGRKQ